MRFKGLIVLLWLQVILCNLFGQQIANNICDSATMDITELQKCTIDSVFRQDIILQVNYIIYLKTGVLPRFRTEKKNIQVPASITKKITQLKKIYDSTVNRKLQVFEEDMDSNQKYVQPKAYIATLLNLETFKFYPDVYAMLINDLHLMLKPKTSLADLKRNKVLCEQIINTIPHDLYNLIANISDKMQEQKNNYPDPKPSTMFQGPILQEERKRYDVLNFLIWTD